MCYCLHNWRLLKLGLHLHADPDPELVATSLAYSHEDNTPQHPDKERASSNGHAASRPKEASEDASPQEVKRSEENASFLSGLQRSTSLEPGGAILPIGRIQQKCLALIH